MAHILAPRHKNHHIAYYRGPPPGFDNPEAWFEFTDYPKPKGSITQEQILNSIYAALRPRNTTQRVYLRTRVQDSWIRWDPSHYMRLNKAEFMHCGIVPFLWKLHKQFLETFRPEKIQPPSDSNASKLRKSIGRPPKLSYKERWFDHYDIDCDGYLAQDEVIQGLIETLKVKSDKEKSVVHHTIERAWPYYDDDCSGQIDKWEFRVKGGMHDYLLMFEQEWKDRPNDRTSYHFLNLYVKGSRRHSYIEPPGLEEPEKWFHHFDFDHTGKLTEKEAINGLYATLNATTQEERLLIRKIVTSVWEDYDEDADDVITLNDFVKEDGLAEMFLGYEEYWKENVKNTETDKDSSGDVVVKIKVLIPNNKKPGDALLVSSPKTQEMVMLVIPDKIIWGGGETEPYFFTVKF